MKKKIKNNENALRLLVEDLRKNKCAHAGSERRKERLPSVGQECHFACGDIVDRSDEANRTGVELRLYRWALLADLLHRLRHVGLGDFVDVRVVFRASGAGCRYGGADLCRSPVRLPSFASSMEPFTAPHEVCPRTTSSLIRRLSLHTPCFRARPR